MLVPNKYDLIETNTGKKGVVKDVVKSHSGIVAYMKDQSESMYETFVNFRDFKITKKYGMGDTNNA